MLRGQITNLKKIFTHGGNRVMLLVLTGLTASLILFLERFDWRFAIPLILIGLLQLILVTRTFNTSATKRTQSSPDEEKSNNSEQQPQEDAEAVRMEPTEQKQSLKETRLLLLSGPGKESSELSRQLTNWDIRLTSVSSSVRAFSALITAADNGEPYHSVLIDQSHLDMDACQFATAMRAEPQLQTLCLIHYGGLTDKNRSEQLYAAGYSKVLPAPVDKTILFDALHNAGDSFESNNVVPLIEHYSGHLKQQPLDILMASKDQREGKKIQKSLTKAGHQVYMVNAGSEVLDALDNHHFDLAILEADLREVTGIEAIKLYRFAHLNQNWVPFILLTEHPDARLIKACEEADIQHLLVKPINSRNLHDTIAEAIGQTPENEGAYDYPQGRGVTQYQNTDLILDTRQLEQLKRLGKNNTFLVNLISRFEHETERLLEESAQAFLEQRFDQLRTLGHQLQDSSGNLGALSLYRLARRLSRCREDDDKHDFHSLMSEIGGCRVETLEAMRSYLGVNKSSAYNKE